MTEVEKLEAEYRRLTAQLRQYQDVLLKLEQDRRAIMARLAELRQPGVVAAQGADGRGDVGTF